MTDKDKLAVECWLSEFKALRDEIVSRLRAQLIINVLNVTAVGTIAGLAFSNAPDTEKLEIRILLAIPYISSLLGILFCDQARDLVTAGHYIRKKIAPELYSMGLSKEILGWERYIKDVEKSRHWAVKFIFWRPAIYLFLVPSLLAVIITFEQCMWSPEWWWLRLIWIAAVIVAITLFFAWRSERRYWLEG